jgi:acetylornithine deacetylase/succinyl-diaminopimelate desuccinylase-like protein
MLEIKAVGPSHDLHSGLYGGAVENPVTALARLVASLYKADNSPAIEGFLDGIQPLWPWEKETWAQQPLDNARLQELTGVKAFGGDAHYSVLERIWSRPTIEVNGMSGGYQGEGTKTVLPSKAMLKISFRLAANQTTEHTFEVVERHLRAHCPLGITLEFIRHDASEPYLVDPQSGYGRAAQTALRKVLPGVEPALIREGGSIGVVASLKKVLGVDSLLLGLALPDCRAHSPNENFPVENFNLGMDLTGHVLDEITVAWKESNPTGIPTSP